jgi:hypothetical protein
MPEKPGSPATGMSIRCRILSKWIVGLETWCMIARLFMAVLKKSPGYQVDGRVSIALDALDDEQKRAVGGVITDRDHFLAGASDSRKVRRISKDQPLYSLKIPSGLRIIYSRVGDEIVVMDLMRQSTLDRFGRKSSRAKSGRAKKIRAVPREEKSR